jgi:hypothetical protein
MSEAATRDDINEVLNVLRDFMKQVDERFTEMESKYDHLIITINGFLQGSTSTKLNSQLAITSLRSCLFGLVRYQKKQAFH